MNTCNAKADEAFGPVVNGCRDSFDFTLLFEQSILSVLPSAFAIVSGIASIYKLWKQSMKIIPEKNASAPILTILVGSRVTFDLVGTLAEVSLADWFSMFCRCASGSDCPLDHTIERINEVFYTIFSPSPTSRAAFSGALFVTL